MKERELVINVKDAWEYELEKQKYNLKTNRVLYYLCLTVSLWQGLSMLLNAGNIYLVLFNLLIIAVNLVNVIRFYIQGKKLYNTIYRLENIIKGIEETL